MQHKNRDAVLVDGPKIVVRPVRTRESGSASLAPTLPGGGAAFAAVVDESLLQGRGSDNARHGPEFGARRTPESPARFGCETIDATSRPVGDLQLKG